MQRDSLSSSSDDDDDDRQTLVPHHHHHNNINSSPTRHRSTFEISDHPSPTRRSAFCPAKRYLLAFAVFLPILLLILFFPLDLRRTSSSSSPSLSTPAAAASYLEALYFLRNQRTTLIHLLNQTITPNASAAPSPSPLPLNDLYSAILHQINLNTQIQKALLAPYRPRHNNSTDDNDDNSLTTAIDLPSLDVCRKIERPEARRAIEWHPRKDRYLFAICLSGQMSNHLICLEKHMFVAALLDRALVLPSPKFDYDYDQVLDIKHINGCFGRKVVLSFAEFAEARKRKPQIDRFICYVASPPCYLDEEHIKKLKGIGVSVGKIEAAWPEDAKLKTQKKRVADDITAKFASNDEVIAVGDMFYADLEEEWVMQPGGPLAHKCKTVIQPSRLIILTAQRFLQTFLGRNFVALHFRRHGFLKFCNMKEESCFFPVPQAAECILKVVERANAPVIYLSTDAADSETDLLQSMVVSNDKQVPLVKRPSHNSAEKWDALLYRNHLGGDSQVEAMLDKTICAMSSVFIGSSGSTFTDDILRLRRGWGSASHCDEYLCQGEQPNYIASLE